MRLLAFNNLFCSTVLFLLVGQPSVQYTPPALTRNLCISSRSNAVMTAAGDITADGV